MKYKLIIIAFLIIFCAFPAVVDATSCDEKGGSCMDENEAFEGDWCTDVIYGEGCVEPDVCCIRASCIEEGGKCFTAADLAVYEKNNGKDVCKQKLQNKCVSSGEICCVLSGESGENEGDIFSRIGFETGLGNFGEPTQIIIIVGTTILGIIGVVVVGMIVYGGIIWMTAAGNQEKVTKGRKMVVGAVIGLIIITSAYGIAQLVYSSVGGQAGTQGGGGGSGTDDCPTASSSRHSSVSCFDSRNACEAKHLGTCNCGQDYGNCSEGVCCYFGWGDPSDECSSKNGFCKDSCDGGEVSLGQLSCDAPMLCCKPNTQ